MESKATVHSTGLDKPEEGKAVPADNSLPSLVTGHTKTMSSVPERLPSRCHQAPPKDNGSVASKPSRSATHPLLGMATRREQIVASLTLLAAQFAEICKETGISSVYNEARLHRTRIEALTAQVQSCVEPPVETDQCWLDVDMALEALERMLRGSFDQPWVTRELSMLRGEHEKLVVQRKSYMQAYYARFERYISRHGQMLLSGLRKDLQAAELISSSTLRCSDNVEKRKSHVQVQAVGDGNIGHWARDELEGRVHATKMTGLKLMGAALNDLEIVGSERLDQVQVKFEAAIGRLMMEIEEIINDSR